MRWLAMAQDAVKRWGSMTYLPPGRLDEAEAILELYWCARQEFVEAQDARRFAYRVDRRDDLPYRERVRLVRETLAEAARDHRRGVKLYTEAKARSTKFFEKEVRDESQ